MITYSPREITVLGESQHIHLGFFRTLKVGPMWEFTFPTSHLIVACSLEEGDPVFLPAVTHTLPGGHCVDLPSSEETVGSPAFEAYRELTWAIASKSIDATRFMLLRKIYIDGRHSSAGNSVSQVEQFLIDLEAADDPRTETLLHNFSLAEELGDTREHYQGLIGDVLTGIVNDYRARQSELQKEREVVAAAERRALEESERAAQKLEEDVADREEKARIKNLTDYLQGSMEGMEAVFGKD